MDSPPRDRDRDRGAQIYIGHLSQRVEEKDLEREFKEFGDIKNVSVKKGYGFIV